MSGTLIYIIRLLIENTYFFTSIPDWTGSADVSNQKTKQIKVLRLALQELMSTHVGIIKSNSSLAKAESLLHEVYLATKELYQQNRLTPQLTSLRNLVSVSYLMIKQSQKSTKNLGVFYSEDYE